MEYVYRTQGTCSTNIELNVEDGVVKEVAFWGGCNGNLQGISRLVRGMKVADVIAKLEGVHCGGRPTSCPDQLCRALHEMGYIRQIKITIYICDCTQSGTFYQHRSANNWLPVFFRNHNACDLLSLGSY